VVEVVEVVDVVGTDVEVVDVEVVDVVELDVVEVVLVVGGTVVVAPPPPLGPLGDPQPGRDRLTATTTDTLSVRTAKRFITGANYTAPAFRL